MRSNRANTQYIDSNLLNIRKLPIPIFNISNKRLSQSASQKSRNHTTRVEARKLCQGIFRGLPCKIVFIKKQNAQSVQNSYAISSHGSEVGSRSCMTLRKMLEKRAHNRYAGNTVRV